MNNLDALLEEIASPKAIRGSVASVYADALLAEHSPPPDPDSGGWERAHQAIIERWSEDGLEYIKNRAWRVYYQRRDRANG